MDGYSFAYLVRQLIKVELISYIEIGGIGLRVITFLNVDG